MTTIHIPFSVTVIGNHAFFECSSLKQITIPNSVTSIEVEAFANCTNLAEITIPPRVRVIGYRAFGECKNLKNVIVYPNVKFISDKAFYGCEKCRFFVKVKSADDESKLLNSFLHMLIEHVYPQYSNENCVSYADQCDLIIQNLNSGKVNIDSATEFSKMTWEEKKAQLIQPEKIKTFVIATDESYYIPTLIAIRSLSNNITESANVIIIEGDCAREFRKKAQCTFPRNLNVFFLDLSDIIKGFSPFMKEIWDAFQKLKSVHSLCAIRMFFPFVFRHIPHLMQLDTDLIFRKSTEDIYFYLLKKDQAFLTTRPGIDDFFTGESQHRGINQGNCFFNNVIFKKLLNGPLRIPLKDSPQNPYSYIDYYTFLLGKVLGPYCPVRIQDLFNSKDPYWQNFQELRIYDDEPNEEDFFHPLVGVISKITGKQQYNFDSTYNAEAKYWGDAILFLESKDNIHVFDNIEKITNEACKLTEAQTENIRKEVIDTWKRQKNNITEEQIKAFLNKN